MIPPRATYRIQLRPEFGFGEVCAITDYLAELGVSHLYASPYLQAAKGSAHGYDVVSHRQVSPELGGEAAHARMCRGLAARGLGQLLDIVPNHMAIGTEDNVWWWDVLENGRSSRYASYFDVDWHPADEDNRILLPILGDRYADALAGGHLRVVREGARFVVTYYEHRLPLAPRSLGEPLARVAAKHEAPELGFLADALAALPSPNATDRESSDRRHRDKQVIAGLLARLFEHRADLADAVDAELATLSDDAARLDDLLERQNWRLGYWRYALHELPYRRFFDVATLAGLRVEDPRVFDDVHALVLGWLGDGTVDGVRIDHVDGLRDPTGYLEQLRRRAPSAWIVVEKILAPDERLPSRWQVDGTTGYEMIRVIDGAFVDPAGREPLEALWASFGGDAAPWAAQARRARLDVIHQLLASERDRLVDLAAKMIAGEPSLRDVTRRELGDAITELLASLPVYRTYARPGAATSAEDVACLDRALADAVTHRPDVDRRVWATLRRALLLDRAGPCEIELALRFQQTTGAVMAKGIEDTLFYRNAAFVALNEVGGAPERFAVDLDELHAALAANPPRSLIASSTHDTKRGEDVRGRLAVLSEIPDAWAAAVARWSSRAAPHRTGDLPDRPTEYLIWQTLVGAWPLDAARLRAYLEKACREAKRRTSWLSPDADYEAAVARFAEGVLADAGLCAEVETFVGTIAQAAWRNTLARTLIKLTAPGIPDVYQGTELPDFSLVDPDNRRPVDFDRRRALLARARDASPEDALAGIADGLPKLWLVHRALAVRKREAAAFDGEYRRLEVTGPEADRVIAFERGGRVAVIVPRLAARVASWAGTAVALGPGAWADGLAGGPVEVHDRRLPVERAWARFPVALLVRRS